MEGQVERHGLIGSHLHGLSLYAHALVLHAARIQGLQHKLSKIAPGPFAGQPLTLRSCQRLYASMERAEKLINGRRTSGRLIGQHIYKCQNVLHAMTEFTREYLLASMALLALGYVLDGQEDEVQMIETARIEQHRAATNALEVVLNLEIVEAALVGQDVLEQGSQLRKAS